MAIHNIRGWATLGGTAQQFGSKSINQYKACPGVAILATPPGKPGPVPMYFRQPQEGELAYEQAKKLFADPDPDPGALYQKKKTRKNMLKLRR